ncbi:hypothetical protein EK904_005324 [Melospiza melodia maxima]|nr:hypothetical protein EK904_005324 [Melospiza melodia maxima]
MNLTFLHPPSIHPYCTRVTVPLPYDQILIFSETGNKSMCATPLLLEALHPFLPARGDGVGTNSRAGCGSSMAGCGSSMAGCGSSMAGCGCTRAGCGSSMAGCGSRRSRVHRLHHSAFLTPFKADGIGHNLPSAKADLSLKPDTSSVVYITEQQAQFLGVAARAPRDSGTSHRVVLTNANELPSFVNFHQVAAPLQCPHV